MKSAIILLVLAAFAQFSIATIRIDRISEGMWKHLNHEPNFLKSASQREKFITVKGLDQKLDHFDVQNNQPWRQRYFEVDDFLVDGGPIFLFVGGDWIISEVVIMNGQVHDMARDLNGILFYTEQRFSGRSRPTTDLSMDNLRFLSTAQILEDTAHFINHVKSTNPQLRNSGVILVGASFSASIVTWFQQKYPHLSNGAWASSGPILAKVDHSEYIEVVSEVLEEVGGTECSGRIQRAFAELERLVSIGDSATISEIYHFCDPLDLTNQLDIWSFFNTLAQPFMGLVQSNSEENNMIKNQCGILTRNSNISDVQALSHMLYGIWSGNETPFCNDFRYENWLQYNETSWDSFGVRQLQYKFCSEVRFKIM